MSRPPTPKLTSDHLADIGLFGGLSRDTLEVLASSIPASRVEAGDMVVEEGTTSTRDVQKAVEMLPSEKFLGFVINKQKSAQTADGAYYHVG